MEILFLCGAAFVAGFFDSIVGGGGLIQLPAVLLLLPGLPIPTAFGTNKTAAIFGNGVAMWQYSQQVKLRWDSILPTTLAAFGAAYFGAWTVRAFSHFRPDLLRGLVLFLLVAVAVHTFLKKDLGELHHPRWAKHHERWAGTLVGLGLGFYDGFFGPGTGTFLLFAFVSLFRFDFLHASAHAKFVNFATNLSPVLYFAWKGDVLWWYSIPMGFCNLIGGFLGSRMAIQRGNRFIRWLFLLILIGLISRLVWDYLRKGSM
ncbi:MAG: sulfite exporter TauE/SafE family protein [Verrucomicrobia bacterium]|nr:sulfite exporter TauE/SafE family protein [Verrucomicrobiota bacterium]